MKKLFILLVFLPLWSCESTPAKKAPTAAEVDQMIRQGEEQIKNSQFQNGLASAEEVLKVNPYSNQALRVKALAKVGMGNLAEGRGAYQELLKGDYKNPEYWLDLGILSILLGDPKEGFGRVKNALEITTIPLDFDAEFSYCFHFPLFYNLAVLAAQVDLLQESERYFRKVGDFKKEYSPSKMALLRLYLTKRPLEDVLKLLPEWKEDKEYKDFILIAHQFYLNNKEYEKAARCILIGLEKISKDFDLFLRLGFTLFQREGLNRETLAALEEAKKITPDHPEGIKLLGLAYLRENSDEAYYRGYLNFQSLTKLKGELPEAHFLYGFCAQKIGKVEEAQGAYKKALGIDPKFWPAQNNLLSLYIESGAYREGTSRLEKEDKENAFFLANLARGYSYLGYSAASKELFNEANKKSKDQKVIQQIRDLQKGK